MNLGRTEEDVLGEYMTKKGYTASYSSQLTVYHVEDASVEYDNKTSVKKKKIHLRLYEKVNKSIN